MPGQPLAVREDPQRGVCVSGLTLHKVLQPFLKGLCMPCTLVSFIRWIEIQKYLGLFIDISSLLNQNHPLASDYLYRTLS